MLHADREINFRRALRYSGKQMHDELMHEIEIAFLCIKYKLTEFPLSNN